MQKCWRMAKWRNTRRRSQGKPSSVTARFYLNLLFSCVPLGFFKPARLGFTKRCCLSLLSNSAHVYEPKCGGGGLGGHSQWVQLCTWSPNKLWRSNSIFNLWRKVNIWQFFVRSKARMWPLTKFGFHQKIWFQIVNLVQYRTCLILKAF